MDSKEAITTMVTNSGKSARAVSAEIGNAETFISSSLRQNKSTTVSTMAKIAHACGYRLALIDSEGNELPLE